MKAHLEAPHRLLQGSLIAFAREAPQFEWNWHYHPQIELTWIRQGHGTRVVGDHTTRYGPGDLVLIGSNLPHTWASAPSRRPEPRANRAIVIQFQAALLPEALLALPEYEATARLLFEARRGLHFSTATARRMGPELLALARERESLLAATRLMNILHELAVGASFRPLASERYRYDRSHRLNSRLGRAVAFIEENYAQEIPLEKVARHAGLSPGAFSKFFRKMTNRTFVDFRNRCRIREACRLLAETDSGITEIAYACGFGNLANFNRRFRLEKETSPRLYRRAYRPSL